MRYGLLILPEGRWSEMGERWRAAEQLGFDHAWTYDHLTWRGFRDRPWFAAVPTLTAAAMETSRIRLGTLVASPNFRHPVPFAKELMTLDDLSGGRVTLGFGAGAESFDASALGQEPWSRRERTERFEEFVVLLDELLRQPTTTRRGRYYHAEEARCIPGCVQRPRVPFALAATGPRGLKLAASHAEAWVWVDSRGDPRELTSRLDEACESAGRDPRSLSRIALIGFESDPFVSVEAFRELTGRLEALGFTDLVAHWPRDEAPFAGRRGSMERIAAEVLGAS